MASAMKGGDGDLALEKCQGRSLIFYLVVHDVFCGGRLVAVTREDMHGQI